MTAPNELQALVAAYLMVPLLGTLAVAVVTAWAIEHGWFDRRAMARRVK